MSKFKRLNIISPISRGWSTAILIERAGNQFGLDTQIFYYSRDITTKGVFPALGAIRGRQAITLILKGDELSDSYIKQLPRPLICWNFDFEREPDYKFARDSFDLYLTICPFFSATQSNMKWLPQGTDSSIFSAIKGQKKLYDLSFIGSPKAPRRKILEFLQDRFPLLKIKVWGEGWGTDLIKPAYYDDFNLAVAQSRMCLAINRYDDFPCYESTFSQRLYMLAACQGFVLAENIPGIDEFFKINPPEEAEVIVWDSLKELLDILTPLAPNLNDEAQRAFREQMGKRARKRVLTEHTYAHRLEKILQWAEEL